MSQQDIIELLENKRKETDQWFTVKDIKHELRELGKSNGTIRGVSNDLYKLCVYNIIEFKGVGLWKHFKVFRAKKVKCAIRRTQ